MLSQLCIHAVTSPSVHCKRHKSKPRFLLLQLLVTFNILYHISPKNKICLSSHFHAQKCYNNQMTSSVLCKSLVQSSNILWTCSSNDLRSCSTVLIEDIVNFSGASRVANSFHRLPIALSTATKCFLQIFLSTIIDTSKLLRQGHLLRCYSSLIS